MYIYVFLPKTIERDMVHVPSGSTGLQLGSKRRCECVAEISQARETEASVDVVRCIATPCDPGCCRSGCVSPARVWHATAVQSSCWPRRACIYSQSCDLCTERHPRRGTVAQQ